MPDQNYVFKGHRVVVTYNDRVNPPQPTKLRFWYDDWFPSEAIARRRRGWILFGAVIGCTITYFIR